MSIKLAAVLWLMPQMLQTYANVAQKYFRLYTLCSKNAILSALWPPSNRCKIVAYKRQTTLNWRERIDLTIHYTSLITKLNYIDIRYKAKNLPETLIQILFLKKFSEWLPEWVKYKQANRSLASGLFFLFQRNSDSIFLWFVMNAYWCFIQAVLG